MLPIKMIPIDFYTPDLWGRIMVWCGRLFVGLSTKLVNMIQTEPFPARTVKLGIHATYDKRTNPIDFRGHGSKAKVTRKTLLLNLVNTIHTESFQLEPSLGTHTTLIMTKGPHY